MEAKSAAGKRLFAFFQGAFENGNVEQNVAKMKTEIRRASALGAEMVIFPELCVSGYRVPSDLRRKLAEEKNGLSFQELSKTAEELKIAVLYGYPELDRSSGREVLYNSAQLIDKDGSSLANYRKTHLWIDEEGYEEIFSYGDSFEVVECCGIKMGLLICFDVEFPECVRELALRGAKLIAVPTAASELTIATTLVACRARENGVYVVYVNLIGEPQLHGYSAAYNPDGDLQVLLTGEEQLALFEVDPLFQPACDFLSMRKPHIYRSSN